MITTALAMARQVTAFRHIEELLRERDVLTARLTEQAYHDALTGLANRALFMSRLAESLGRGPVTVFLVDLDDFKPVNDSFGHATGDQLLIEVGARLRSLVRVGDTVARLGGDEFAILAGALDPDGRAEAADRLSRAPVRDGVPGCGAGATARERRRGDQRTRASATRTPCCTRPTWPCTRSRTPRAQSGADRPGPALPAACRPRRLPPRWSRGVGGGALVGGSTCLSDRSVLLYDGGMDAADIAAGRERWQQRYDAARKRDADFTTLSGHHGRPGLRAAAPGSSYPGFERIGWPGEFPYTRGLYPTGYRGRTWTIRQFAGFGNARQTNERYKMILGAGGGGLSVAFDMPTLMGRDSDDPQSLGEVGHCGVAIDSAADMDVLFDGIDLREDARPA